MPGGALPVTAAPAQNGLVVQAVWMAARAQLRCRWGATVALVLLVGLAGGVVLAAAADAHAFRTMDRPRVLRGRFARLDRADEAIVDDTTARLRHLEVGSRVTMWSFSSEQNTTAAVGGFGKIPAPQGPPYTFRIVGIVRSPADVDVPPATVVGDATYQGAGGLVLTPAFLDRFAQDQGVPYETLPGLEGFRIRLRHGLADAPAFTRALPALDVKSEDVHIGGSDIQNAGDKAQRAIHLEGLALLLFAGLAGLAALLLVGQALGRQVRADAGDSPTLAALGLGPGKLVLVPLVRAALIAVGGAVVSVVVAVALSPLTPIGLARRAEIQPGVSVNVAVLALGFAAVVVLT